MTRPETIDKEIAQILGDLGTCRHISIGIEHGNDRIRREYLNRHISNERMIDAFKLLENAGIQTTSYNMIGFPTETRKEIFETIELNRRINPEIALMSFFYPYKGTPLRDICINMGLIKPNVGMVDYGEESILNMPQISKEEIHGFRRTFILYIRAPKILYPLIKLCERENKISNIIYNIFRIYYSIKMNGEI